MPPRNKWCIDFRATKARTNQLFAINLDVYQSPNFLSRFNASDLYLDRIVHQVYVLQSSYGDHNPSIHHPSRSRISEPWKPELNEFALNKKQLVFIGKLSVSGGILCVIFYLVDWPELVLTLSGADLKLLSWAFSFHFFSFVIQGTRLQILVETLFRKSDIPTFQRVNFVAGFFDIFTPGQLGSDGYRFFALKQKYSAADLAGSLLAMRLQGLTANIIFAATIATAITTLSFGIKALIIVTGLVLALILVRLGLSLGRSLVRKLATLFSNRKSIGDHVDQFAEYFEVMAVNQKRFMTSFAISFLFVLHAAIFFMLVGTAFGLKLPLTDYLLGAPLIMIAASLPVTIQGRGIAELVAIGLWVGPGGSLEQVLVVIIAAHLINITQGALGGLFLIRNVFSTPQPPV